MKLYNINRKYVDHKTLPFYLLLHWKSILSVLIFTLLISLLCSLLSQNAKISHMKETYPDGYSETELSVNAKEIPFVQQYIDNSDKLKAQNEYNQNSLYMKINPDNVYKRYIRVVFSSDTGLDTYSTVLQIGYKLQNESTLNMLAESIGIAKSKSQYVKDLATIDQGVGSNIIITIYAPSEDIANTIGKTFIDQIKKLNDNRMNMTVIANELSVEKIPSIASTQQSYIQNTVNYSNAIQQAQNSLDARLLQYITAYYQNTSAGNSPEIGSPLVYKESVTIPVFSIPLAFHNALIATLVAALLMLFLWYIIFAFTPYAWSDEVLRSELSLNTIGWIKLEDLSYRPLYYKNSWVWNWRNHKKHKYGPSYVDYQLSNRLTTSDAGILIISSWGGQNDKNRLRIKRALRSVRIVDVITPEVLLTKQYNSMLNSNISLLIIEPLGKVQYKELMYSVNVASEFPDKLLGFVSIE